MDAKIYYDQVTNILSKSIFQLKKEVIAGIETHVAIDNPKTMFVIIGICQRIDRETIENFSKESVNYVKKMYPFTKWGGIAPQVYALLISQNIEESAKLFAQKRPKIHFNEFEIPLIYDCKEDKLYYYEKTPIWGALMYKNIRTNINNLFILKKVS
jgi:hypothetical protein